MTPQSPAVLIENPDQLKRRRRFWLRIIWIAMSGVIVPPVIAFAVAFFVMGMAFNDLSQNGTGDPAASGGHISSMLVCTALGWVVAAAAFIVLMVVLIRYFTLPKVTNN